MASAPEFWADSDHGAAGRDPFCGHKALPTPQRLSGERNDSPAVENAFAVWGDGKNSGTNKPSEPNGGFEP